MLETIDFSPKIGMNTYMIEFDNPYAYYKNYYNHTFSTVSYTHLDVYKRQEPR